MKTLIIIGIVVAAIAIAVTVMGLIAPKVIKTSNTVVINVPSKQVYSTARFMKNFALWSPWKDTDPEQKTSVSGPDGELGARYSWVGVKEKGKGYQEIVGLQDGKQIDLDCHIAEPFEAHPTFSFVFEDVGGKTKVTQVFESKLAFPATIFAMLMGLQQNIEKTNTRGLEKLKMLCENTPTAATY